MIMLKTLKKFYFLGAVAVLVLPTLSGCKDSKSFSLARSTSAKDMQECMGLVKKKKYEKSIKCFESYKSRHYGTSNAALADLAVADAYFLKKDYLLAAQSYRMFIEGNPYHEKIPYAYYKAGVSFLRENPKSIDRDQTNLENAVQYLGAVLKYYRNTEYAAVARKEYNAARLKQAEKHYYVGRFYFKTNEYLAAIPRFQTIVTDFNGLGLDEQSFYYLIKSLNKTGQKEVGRRYFEVFKESYANSPYVKKISSLF